MKINSLIIAMLLLISSASTFATVSFSPVWDKVAFDAAQFHVKAEVGKDSHVSNLAIWYSGKKVLIPRKDYVKIYRPVLNTITITYGLGDSYYLTVPVHTKFKDACDPNYDARCRWVFYFTGTKYTGMEEPEL